jgi:UPF0716 protein FxsA
MIARLFLLLVLTFFAELSLLLWFADEFGWNVALGEVLLSGVLGLLVVRWRNASYMRRVKSQLATGETPATAVLHGLLILLAGILLILPGLLTDLLGLLLLVPLFRKLLGMSVAIWFHRRFRASSYETKTSTQAEQAAHQSERPTSRIIDVRVVDRPQSDSQGDAPGNSRREK